MISGRAFGAYGMPGAMLAPAYPSAYVASPGLGPLAASTNSMYGGVGYGGVLGNLGPLELTGLVVFGAFLVSSILENQKLKRRYQRK